LLATQYVGRSAMAADAVRYAKQRAAVLLLKGPRSLITDGLRIAHNGSGGPGLATAGTGDVLSGVIAAIAAQGIAPFEATRLGAWLHGLAGDLSGAELTAPGMTARDVLAALPAAWQSLLI
jgi:ADP-dependent NAD(P)H-hydrate dehydratase